MVTMVGIKYPELREQLSILMAHSLHTATKWYNIAIQDRQVCVDSFYTLGADYISWMNNHLVRIEA